MTKTNRRSSLPIADILKDLPAEVARRKEQNKKRIENERNMLNDMRQAILCETRANHRANHEGEENKSRDQLISDEAKKRAALEKIRTELSEQIARQSIAKEQQREFSGLQDSFKQGAEHIVKSEKLTLQEKEQKRAAQRARQQIAHQKKEVKALRAQEEAQRDLLKAEHKSSLHTIREAFKRDDIDHAEQNAFAQLQAEAIRDLEEIKRSELQRSEMEAVISIYKEKYHLLQETQKTARDAIIQSEGKEQDKILLDISKVKSEQAMKEQREKLFQEAVDRLQSSETSSRAKITQAELESNKHISHDALISEESVLRTQCEAEAQREATVLKNTHQQEQLVLSESSGRLQIAREQSEAFDTILTNALTENETLKRSTTESDETIARKKLESDFSASKLQAETRKQVREDKERVICKDLRELLVRQLQAEKVRNELMRNELILEEVNQRTASEHDETISLEQIARQSIVEEEQLEFSSSQSSLKSDTAEGPVASTFAAQQIEIVHNHRMAFFSCPTQLPVIAAASEPTPGNASQNDGTLTPVAAAVPAQTLENLSQNGTPIIFDESATIAASTPIPGNASQNNGTPTSESASTLKSKNINRAAEDISALKKELQGKLEKYKKDRTSKAAIYLFGPVSFCMNFSVDEKTRQAKHSAVSIALLALSSAKTEQEISNDVIQPLKIANDRISENVHSIRYRFGMGRGELGRVIARCEAAIQSQTENISM